DAAAKPAGPVTRRSADLKVSAPGIQDSTALEQGVIPHVVDEDVEPFAALREIFAGVVDDSVCADRMDHLDISCAADTGHLGTKRPGDLHREGSDSSRGAVDEDLPARPGFSLSQGLERRTSRDRRRGRLLERDVAWLREQRRLRTAREIGERSPGGSENLVAALELSNLRPDRLDDPGDIRAEPRFLRASNSEHQSDE